jgi:hypothetical protein
MSLHHPSETTDLSPNTSDFPPREKCATGRPKRKHRKLVCILSLHHSSCLVCYPPTIIRSLHAHPSSNNTVSLRRRRSLRSIIHRITSPLRLIAALRWLQLIRIIVSIVAIIAVEGRACSLVGDRWFVGRSCAAVVGLVGVVSSIVSVLLTEGRLVTPVSSHPASSVHGGHAATTATAAVVAPVNWGQWGEAGGREERNVREEESQENECDDDYSQSDPSPPGVPSRVAVTVDIVAVGAAVHRRVSGLSRAELSSLLCLDIDGREAEPRRCQSEETYTYLFPNLFKTSSTSMSCMEVGAMVGLGVCG